MIFVRLPLDQHPRGRKDGAVARQRVKADLASFPQQVTSLVHQGLQGRARQRQRRSHSRHVVRLSRLFLGVVRGVVRVLEYPKITCSQPVPAIELARLAAGGLLGSRGGVWIRCSHAQLVPLLVQHEPYAEDIRLYLPPRHRRLNFTNSGKLGQKVAPLEESPRSRAASHSGVFGHCWHRTSQSL